MQKNSNVFFTFGFMFCCSFFLSLAQASEPKNYLEHRKAQLAKYNTFKKRYLSRYEAYREKIKKRWGVAELSSRAEYIMYSEDNNTKVIADFEKNTIEVSLLDEDKLSESEIDATVKKAIVSALNVTPKIIAETNKEFAPSSDKVIAFNTIEAMDLSSRAEAINLINTENDVVVPSNSLLNALGIEDKNELDLAISEADSLSPTKQQEVVIARTKKRLETQISVLDHFTNTPDASHLARKNSELLLDSMKKELRSIEQSHNLDLTAKNIITYKINLRGSRAEKAKKYLNIVNKESEKWQLQQAIILAIMETESHFNPMAKSYIPAFGLMQIVPSTAGADVNNKIFRGSKKPTPELLYVGEENIQFGAAYFNLLMTRYLAGVENETSKTYCAIAAYNTGIGNLARAFNGGKKGRKEAIKKINELTPDEVYQVIKSKTHQETQRYLDKVLESKNYFSTAAI
ncbi:murein transglycosylase domain-containing protein [Thalassotalea sp. PLHSN55]|uniref:transglycosylase SLT domain-containing protein n=1 Tax=Thalassotalea sp. PLHSN55 TaxID=3435888 RepID=UPI003F8616D8